MRRSAGFTLYELLFVMMILGVLVALARPHIDPQDHTVRNASQTVGSTLLMAQRLAVTGQHDVLVAFDTDAAMMRIHEDGDNDGEIDDSERVRHIEIDEIAFARGPTPPHPVIGADATSFAGAPDGLPALRFQRDGSVAEEGGLYLTTLRAERTGSAQYAEDTRAVVVERATGRASWFRYHDAEWERVF